MAYHEVHNAVCHFGVVGSDVSDIIMLSYKYDCCGIIFLSYDMWYTIRKHYDVRAITSIVKECLVTMHSLSMEVTKSHD